MGFNLEDKIRWEELAPSLQKKFADLENMINDIVDWVSFVNTLNYIGGNFYLSNYANQDWHHDKKYCKLRRYYRVNEKT